MARSKKVSRVADGVKDGLRLLDLLASCAGGESAIRAFFLAWSELNAPRPPRKPGVLADLGLDPAALARDEATAADEAATSTLGAACDALGAKIAELVTANLTEEQRAAVLGAPGAQPRRVIDGDLAAFVLGLDDSLGSAIKRLEAVDRELANVDVRLRRVERHTTNCQPGGGRE